MKYKLIHEMLFMKLTSQPSELISDYDDILSTIYSLLMWRREYHL